MRTLTTAHASVYTDAGGVEMAKYYNEVAKRAQEKYDKANIKGLYLKLNINTDADILARLEQVAEGKQGYIKRLIREDMEKNA